MAFNPEVRIRAFHQNIKDSQFNREFFQKYSIVLNALDNLDARRHVNRLCLAYGIPLIESGTTGYIGQAMPIIKNVTECYECQPKITQKVYPICTIRSTPSQPVHCIVWGKEFYKLVFGNRPESLLFEDESTEESTFMKYLPFPTSVQGSPPPALVISYAINILKALFCTEIDKKKSMGLYRTSDRIPEPLDQATLTEAEEFATKLFVHGEALSRPSERRGWERNEWNLVDCLIELISCFISIYCDEDRRSLIGSFVFDKDDRLAMIFVTASSVIRSRIFRISCLSYHDTKGVAGNIIPAIASTNAIIAGLQVVEAIRLLQMKFTSTKITPQLCRTTYCQRMPTRRGYYLQPTVSPDPNPKCYICGTSQLIVEVFLIYYYFITINRSILML